MRRRSVTLSQHNRETLEPTNSSPCPPRLPGSESAGPACTINQNFLLYHEGVSTLFNIIIDQPRSFAFALERTTRQKRSCQREFASFQRVEAFLYAFFEFGISILFVCFGVVQEATWACHILSIMKNDLFLSLRRTT